MNDPSYRNTSFDELVDVYSEQILGLIDGNEMDDIIEMEADLTVRKNHFII